MVSQRVDDREVLIDADQENAEDGSSADQAGAALGQVAHVALVKEASVFISRFCGRHYFLPLFEDLHASVSLDDEFRRLVEDLLAGRSRDVLQGGIGDRGGWFFGLLVHQQKWYEQEAREQVGQQEIDDESAREKVFWSVYLLSCG